jgi:AcrR family transcriptional regulator
MLARSKETRQALLDAVIQLVARGGPEAATTQAIARHVGVTEGAIYRHFRSKVDLRWAAYRSVVNRMIAEKEQLARSSDSVRDTVGRWIRLTYRSFDENPEAFAYVFLRPHAEFVTDGDRQLTRCQGEIFVEWVKSRQARGEVRVASPLMLLSHFTGMMLNVPRLVEEGTLDGPAEQYADEVTLAVWLAFRPDDGDTS